jgi:hypothetical protein
LGEIVNLRRARKAQVKRRREDEATANRLAFGRPKAERQLTEASETLERARLDAHRLDRDPRDDSR